MMATANMVAMGIPITRMNIMARLTTIPTTMAMVTMIEGTLIVLVLAVANL